MEFLVSFLFLALNLINDEIGINSILFLMAGTALMCILAYICYLKTRNYITTCLCLMCHVWPFSWVNIFGGPSYTLELTWFYIVGACIALWAIFNFRKLSKKKVNAVVLGVFIATFVIFIYPLIISRSLSSGLSDFIMIGFFLVLCFVAFLNSSTMDEKNRRRVVTAYIWSVVISSVMIIFQFSYYQLFSDMLFRFSVAEFNGGTMLSAKLLMEDASTATIMLGSAVFFMLERFNKKDKRFLYLIFIFITVLAMALTTRRTSIISLVIFLALYAMIYYKKTSYKILMTIVFFFVIAVMLYYLMQTRPADSYGVYLDDNGRFSNYLSSIRLFFEHPFGLGYDNDYLVEITNSFIVHNSFLRWLNMGGIFLAAAMVYIIGYITYVSFKKKLNDEKWLLLYCLFAMNFIPDILNARFFVIPCMLVLLCKGKDDFKAGTVSKHNGLLERNIK